MPVAAKARSGASKAHGILGPRLARQVNRARIGKLQRLVACLEHHDAVLPPRGFHPRQFRTWLTEKAIHGLAHRFPGESARERLSKGQCFTLGLVFAGLPTGLSLAPLPALHTLAGIATVFFGFVVMLRVSACINTLAGPPSGFRRRRLRPIANADLPVYTILVPLFREKAVLRKLTQALMALDYPAEKKDIKLIFESIDRETLEFAGSLHLPDEFELVVVPDSFPRTKPKALNYAMQLARGDYVVVYDAEDRPDPLQLRKALNAFRAGPPNLACLQARLIIDNGSENWLTSGIWQQTHQGGCREVAITIT